MMVPMRALRTSLLLATLTSLPAVTLHAADDTYGAEVYTKNCAQCHEQTTEARVPPRATLEKMTSAAIIRALETGVMREMGAKITLSERIEQVFGIAGTCGIGRELERLGRGP
jgi:mono/diheme cytochrome c family protein